MQKAYYRPSRNEVKYNAFMPNKNGETSVYRTINLEENEIYDIGKQYVAKVVGKPLLGRAEIPASMAIDFGLKIQPKTEPHPRHANIIDYPDDDSEKKLIALQLAAEAKLYLI